MYIKVNGDIVVAFPYSEYQLQLENPDKLMVPVHDICALYSGTAEALETGNSVAPVIVDERPSYDSSVEFLQYDLSTLRKENGSWRLGWQKQQVVNQPNVVGVFVADPTNT